MQVVLLGLLSAAVLVVTLLFGWSILDAQRDADRQSLRAQELQELRGELRDKFVRFWTNRFEGRDGLSPDVREAFTTGAADVQRLATPAPSDPRERAAVGVVFTELLALGQIVTADFGDVAIGSAADRASVRRAAAIIERLDRGIVAWSTRAGELTAERTRELRSLTRTLMTWLAVLVGVLAAVGAVLWLLMERTRTRIVGTMRAEHAALGAVITSVQDGLAVVAPDGALREVNDRLVAMTGFSREELLTHGPPVPYLSSTELPADFEGERDLVITRKDGSTMPVILSASRLAGGHGMPDSRVHTIKDVTERKAAEAELRALAAEQAALRRAATAVAAGAEPRQIFELVAREVANLLGVESGVVSHFDLRAGREEQVSAWTRPGSGIDKPPTRVPLDGGSALAVVYRTGEPALVDYAELGKPSSQLILDRGYRRGVAAPVRVGAALWGAVSAGTADKDRLPPGSELRLARFAELVGLTVANADARSRLIAQAATDPLTKLANHRTFHERLEHEVARAAAEGEDLALALFDLDHFKEVNDAHGHQVGDGVLAEFARRLASQARYGELVARIGGEEFGWILPGSDGLNGWKAAERVRRIVAERDFGSGVGKLSVSAGVCDLTQAASAPELMRLADGALYWAKASGRDLSVHYSPEVVQELSAQERAERLTRSQAVAALRALARAVDAKDPSTARHSERVAEVAVELASAMGWDADRIALLNEAARLHDVGKIGLPDTLLFTAGPFDADERRQVEGHAALGAEIVSDVLNPEQVAWVRCHHERWDGDGYPDRLSGDRIPEGARILAVADAWDAMTSVRTYNDPIPRPAAVEECKRCAGSQFAPAAVEALVWLWETGGLPEPRDATAQETPSL